MSDRLRVVFMGSPEFAVPCLEALHESEEVIAVLSQPDKPAGRGLALLEPAVKKRARELGLRVEQPASIRKPSFLEEFTAWRPDLAVVVAYGKILPPEILAVPRFGCFNVHGSLLPKLRGAAPIQWAILNGERETGVTLMQMDAGMDTGPILLKRSWPIGEQVTAGELYTELAPLGAALLAEGLLALKAGTLSPEPQDSAQATLAPMLAKENGRVDFRLGAVAVHNRVRGCDPWPGAFTVFAGEPLKLFRSKRISGSGEPGRVLGVDRDGLWVGCGEGAVAFGELQLPGKRRMAAQALLAGRPIPIGTRLG